MPGLIGLATPYSKFIDRLKTSSRLCMAPRARGRRQSGWAALDDIRSPPRRAASSGRDPILRARKCISALRVKPALLARHEDALAGDHIGRGPKRNALGVRHVPDMAERVDHDLLEARVDLLLRPEE